MKAERAIAMEVSLKDSKLEIENDELKWELEKLKWEVRQLKSEVSAANWCVIYLGWWQSYMFLCRITFSCFISETILKHLLRGYNS